LDSVFMVNLSDREWTMSVFTRRPGPAPTIADGKS